MRIQTSKAVMALFFGAFLLSGCAGAEAVVGKIGATVAKPVFGLAVKDAQTTLAWIEAQQAAGSLSDGDAGLARVCPEAVIALDALRAQLAGDDKTGVDGFKGLIYYGTLSRFEQGVQSKAMFHLQKLVGSCMPLVPAEKLIRFF